MIPLPFWAQAVVIVLLVMVLVSMGVLFLIGLGEVMDSGRR